MTDDAPAAAPPKRRKGGSKPGERRGGRKPGSKNKKTLEKERVRALAQERELLLMEARAEQAGTEVQVAQAKGKRLMKEVMFEFAHLFAGMAAYYQPTPPDSPRINAHANEAKFLEYAKLATQVARDAAPYESPRLAAMMVGGAVVQQIVITGGIPDDEDGGFEDAPADARTIELQPIAVLGAAVGAGNPGGGTDPGAGDNAVLPPGPTGAPAG